MDDDKYSDIDAFLGVKPKGAASANIADIDAFLGVEPSDAKPRGSMAKARASDKFDPNTIEGIISRKAAEYGLPPGLMLRLAAGESSFDPRAKTGTSSGLFQLQDKKGGSWRQYGTGSPFDPTANADAGMRYTLDNIKYLRDKLGREPTENEILLAHQQGRAGAIALIQNPDKPASEVLAKFYGGNARDAIVGNRGKMDMTSAQLAEHVAGQYSEDRANRLFAKAHPLGPAPTEKGPLGPTDRTTSTMDRYLQNTLDADATARMRPTVPPMSDWEAMRNPAMVPPGDDGRRFNADGYQGPAKSSPAQQSDGTTPLGLASSAIRGLAPTAIGAGVGGAIGGPPGAALGAGLVSGVNALTGLYRPVSNAFGTPKVMTPNEATDAALDMTGLPRPKTEAERVTESTAENAIGAYGLALGAGQVANQLAPGLGKYVAEAMARDPLGQAASGAGGGALGQIGAETTNLGGPLASEAGGAIGNIIGSVLPSALHGAARLPRAVLPKPEMRPAPAETANQELSRLATQPIVLDRAGTNKRIATISNEIASGHDPNKPSPTAPPPETVEQMKARDLIQRRYLHDMKASGLSPSDYAVSLVEEANKSPTAPTALMDLGKNMQGAAGSSGRIPGPGKQTMENIVRGRNALLHEMRHDAINRSFNGGDVYTEMKRLNAARKAAAKPFYDAAYSRPPIDHSFMEPDGEIGDILKTPSGKRALKEAYEIAAEERRKDDILQLHMEADGSITVEITPSWQTLDYIKSGFDKVFDDERDKYTGKKKSDRRTLGIENSLDEYRAILMRENPDFAQAWKAYSGPSQIMRAIGAGEDVFNEKMSATKMADLVANWSPEELEGARLGAAKKLKTGNIPWTPEQRPETIARLRPLFPNDEARLQKFVDAIDAKRRISETNTRVNAGSQTGLNRVEDDDAKNVSTAIRGAEAVASKNLLRIGRFVHDTYTDWRNKSDPEVLNEIAKALGSPLRYGSPGMNMLEKFANAAPSTRRHMLPLTNSFSAFSPAVPFPGEGDRR